MCFLRRGTAAIVIILCLTAQGYAQQRSPRAGASRQEASRTPATQRSNNRSARNQPAEPPDERTEDAIKALTTVGGLAGFSKAAERDLVGLLSSPQENADLIIRLTAWREFGKFFSRIANPTAAELESLKWLASNTRARNALMMAIGHTEQPDAVLKVFTALQHDQKDLLEKFPDLTAAMCVVWDTPQPRGRVEPRAARGTDMNRPLLLMRYYTQMRNQLQIDPQDLPWELAVYVVANQVTTGEEALWALNRYSNRGALGGTFFDVTYDYDRFYGGSKGRLAEHPYTLDNILMYGGICADQAYYATQVARSCGVPAITATGVDSTAGVLHAWVGYLDTNRNGIYWDFESGRYAENRYWRGNVIDPQTQETITDADVSVLAELSQSKPQYRLLSVALTKTANLGSSDGQGDRLMQAINLSPGNRIAWEQLASMGKANRLTPAQLSEIYSAITRFAASEYPDFAFSILKEANEGRGTTQQLLVLDEMTKLFGNRPDLLAAIGAARGDLFWKEKRGEDAMAAYGDVLNRYLNVAPIVNDTLQRVDRMLREAGALPRLADVYDIVWKRLPTPESSIGITGTPFYRIGVRYRDLLKDLGDDDEANKVDNRLQSVVASINSRQPGQ